jgi:hypothetical protein
MAVFRVGSCARVNHLGKNLTRGSSKGRAPAVVSRLDKVKAEGDMKALKCSNV